VTSKYTVYYRYRKDIVSKSY